MNTFSNRLKQAMDERNMTQAELSALTGIGKPSISQYLSGKNEPKHDNIKKIADALQVNESFLDGTEEVMDEEVKDFDKNLPVEEAAKIMGKSKQFVRVGLQRGLLPFGSAVKLSSRWTYYISPPRFYEYVGQK